MPLNSLSPLINRLLCFMRLLSMMVRANRELTSSFWIYTLVNFYLLYLEDLLQVVRVSFYIYRNSIRVLIFRKQIPSRKQKGNRTGRLQKVEDCLSNYFCYHSENPQHGLLPAYHNPPTLHICCPDLLGKLLQNMPTSHK